MFCYKSDVGLVFGVLAILVTGRECCFSSQRRYTSYLHFKGSVRSIFLILEIHVVRYSLKCQSAMNRQNYCLRDFIVSLRIIKNKSSKIIKLLRKILHLANWTKIISWMFTFANLSLICILHFVIPSMHKLVIIHIYK